MRVDQGFQDVREEIRATVREEIRATNNRIDRLTLAVLGVGGGVIVALISLAGILAIQLIRSG
jgi:CHASE3 domain sensor protein